MQSKPRVGIVGVGNMGAPMARNVAKGGHAVVLFDLNSAALDPFRHEKGFAVAESLGDLGRQSDIVITMLPNSAVVRAAVMGSAKDEGIARGLVSRKAATPSCPAIIIDMSSSYALDTRKLGAEPPPNGVEAGGDVGTSDIVTMCRARAPCRRAGGTSWRP